MPEDKKYKNNTRKGVTSTIDNFLAIVSKNFRLRPASKDNQSDTSAKRIKHLYDLSNRTSRKQVLDAAAERNTTTNVTNTTTTTGVEAYASAIAQRTINNSEENKRILRLIPELNKASKLFVASICSPNKLSQNKFTISCGNHPDIDHDSLVSINALLSEFFEKSLCLSTKLPLWIKNACYIYGSQPLMVLPTSTLVDLLKDERGPQSTNTTTDTGSIQAELDDKWVANCSVNHESFIKTFNTATTWSPLVSLEQFDYPPPTKESLSSQLYAANESLCDVSLRELYRKNNAPKVGKENILQNGSVPNLKAISKALVASFVSSESLEVTDNPDVIGLRPFYHRVAEFKNKQGINAKYNLEAYDYTKKDPYDPMDIMAIPLPNTTESIIGNPLSIQLPPESVTTVFTPGAENDPLFYIVQIDPTDGSPISGSVAASSSMGTLVRQSSQSGSGANISSIFKAFGEDAFNQSSRSGSPIDFTPIKNLYKSIIEDYLKNKCSEMGYTGITLGNNENLFQSLFHRYLNQRQTRLVIVPKELMSYLMFEVDENGVGVSMLEDSKFPATLRLNSLVCRVLNGIVNSIDRTKLDVTVGENFRGNTQVLRAMVEQEWKMKEGPWNFTFDPSVISEQRNSRAVSINIVGGGPEKSDISGFNINSEKVQRTLNPIDDNLDEILDKLLSTTMLVPPSVLNQLSDAEFSSSVLTSNEFFTMYVSSYQAIVTSIINKHLRTFGKHSSYLRQAILRCINASEDTKEKDASSIIFDEKNRPIDNKDGTVSRNDSKKKSSEKLDQNDLLSYILSTITLVLPKPDLTPSKNQLDKFNDTTTNIATNIDALYPDDLAGNDDLIRTALQLMKSHLKAKICTAQAIQLGIPQSCIPSIDRISGVEVRDMSMRLQNFAASLVSQTTALTGKDGNDTFGSSGGGGDLGGGDDYGIGGGGDFDPGSSDDLGDKDLNNLADDVEGDL